MNARFTFEDLRALVSNAGVVDVDIAKFDKTTRHLVHLDSPK